MTYRLGICRSILLSYGAALTFIPDHGGLEKRWRDTHPWETGTSDDNRQYGRSPRTVQRRMTRMAAAVSKPVARWRRQRLSQTMTSPGFQAWR